MGFKQNTDSSGVQFSADLTTSRSGLTYNVSPYLTARNLLAMAPDYVTQAEDLSAAFNGWLKDMVDDLLAQMIRDWWTKKAAENTARPLLTVRDAYWYEDRLQFGVATAGQRLGLQVAPIGRSQLLTAKIYKVGLILSRPTTVNVHLQHFNKNTPEETLEFDYIGHGEEQWEAVNWTVPFADARSFFVYYNSDDLGEAQVVISRGGCACKNSMRHATVFGFKSDEPTTNTQFFPVTGRENYGLNLRMELHCDYTTLPADLETMFAPLASLYVGCELLKHMAQNPEARLGRHEGVLDPDRILYEINGDPRGRKTGLAEKLEDAWASVEFGREGYDSLCLPCNEDYGISRQRN